MMRLPPLSAACAACLTALLPAPAVCAQNAAIQTPEAITIAARAYLLERLATLPGQPSVTIDPPRAERLALCQTALTPFMPSNTALRSRMTIGVRCNGPSPWTTYVQASVSVPGDYYVASRMIAAGQALTPADLEPRAGDLATLPPGVVTRPDAVIGMTAAYRINAGQPVKNTALRHAQSVIRGAHVRLNAHGNGFMVSSEGQALGNAAPGATVQVRTASGQIVSGVVRNASLVDIPL